MKVIINHTALLLFLLLVEGANAFSHQHNNDNLAATYEYSAATSSASTTKLKGRISRRIFVDMAVLPLSILLINQGHINVANAATMENSQKVFVAGKELTIEQAKERIVKGQESLVYLIDHFEEIVDGGGGDNVRRYLGTVGTTSGMYGISRVMKQLQDEADDIVEYTETMNEVNSAIAGAE